MRETTILKDNSEGALKKQETGFNEAETLVWKKHPFSRDMKGNNAFECYCSKGQNFVRKDGPSKLTYQLFLNEENYKKIRSALGGGSWTFYEGSVIHFYGGNYIYIENGRTAFEKFTAMIGIKTVWR